MNSRMLAIFLVLAAVSVAGNPIIVDRAPAPADLFALGDIHGDLDRARRLLTVTGLVNETGWTGGRDILVVTGDMIDKGPQSLGVLRFLSTLRVQAAKAGGEVIVLAGNHEVEFLANPSGSKSREFGDELRSAGYDPANVAKCQGEIGEILCSLPFAARVGDWFFSHAGNTSGRTLAEVTRAIRDGMASQGYAAPELIDTSSILEARLGDGKKWIGSNGENERLSTYANALGVHHIVQGHQHGEVTFSDGIKRNAGEVFQRWGLLFLIDVGMSRDIGDSSGAILRIRSGASSAICPDGTEALIWSEAGAQDVGRALPCH